MGLWPFLAPNERHQQGCAGWKYIAALDIPGHAEKTASEAVALLTAPHCPIDTVTDVIIAGTQLTHQESCGHPIELDRVMGAEAAYAGAYFLDKLNNFNYGSEFINNITADSLRHPGLGTFGWDGEGVGAQSTPIVKDGRSSQRSRRTPD